MRKSFLIHIDSLDILEELDNNQCGELFRAIKAYQTNEEIKLSSFVKVAFCPFKNQFKRDSEKYIKTCEARALAGSRGGKQKVANASKCKQKVANLAESKSKSKSKSDSDSDSKNKIKRILYQEILDSYHEALPDNPRVSIYSDERKRKVKGIWNLYDQHKNIDWWVGYFNQISTSQFLTGKVENNNRKPFKADFDFILNKANFVKIVEGKYHE
ncbi:MAG: hypothetical protein ACI9N9_002380 [Enterobacterales bacterium]|jgi:hypothetical protein